MIDTHAHLQNLTDEELNIVLENAKQNGVNKIICASSGVLDSFKATLLAENNKGIFATVGVHPQDACFLTDDAIQKLRDYAKNNKAVAIGEIGLDYHYEGYDKDVQINAFLKQIDLAYDLGLPVVIHTRDASGDTMQIIRENLHKFKSGVCIHCYSMSQEILKEIIGYGFYISLGGTVTFKNAKNIQEIAKICPLDRIMLETDCPYMSPEPFRGKTNEPKNVMYVAQKIADLRGISVEEVKTQTTQNAIKFFNLSKETL